MLHECNIYIIHISLCIMWFSIIFQDRRDFVGVHGTLDSLGGGGGGGSFSNTHRLRHTPNSVADFQPPYFPPPYCLPQQTMEFHHVVNPDPYTTAAHLNHHYNTAMHNQSYIPSDRHLLSGGGGGGGGGGGCTGVNQSLQRGFVGAYESARRPSEYSTVVSRPSALIPSSRGGGGGGGGVQGGHDLHESSLFGLSSGNTGLNGLDDGLQVCLHFRC